MIPNQNDLTPTPHTGQAKPAEPAPTPIEMLRKNGTMLMEQASGMAYIADAVEAYATQRGEPVPEFAQAVIRQFYFALTRGIVG